MKIKKAKHYSLKSFSVDASLEWKFNDEQSVKAAQEKFEELKKDGFFIYQIVSREDIGEELEINEFHPYLGTIYFREKEFRRTNFLD